MLSAARQDRSAVQYALHCDMQIYSGAASETAFVGKESPGPMAYDQHRSGIGRQVSTPALVCCTVLSPVPKQLLVAHH